VKRRILIVASLGALVLAVGGHSATRACATRYDLMQSFGGPGGNLRAALAWLASNPQTCSLVSSGTYFYTGVLDIPAGADIQFQSTTLRPQTITASAIRLRGSGTKLSFSGTSYLGNPVVPPRYGNAEASGIESEGASNFTIQADDLTIEGVGSVGMFFYRNSGPGVIQGKVSTRSTGEDSFHVTQSSHDLDFQAQLYSYNSGDDGFAVVSYTANPVPTTNIHWHYVVLRDCKRCRGISVVGGKNVTVDYADIGGTSGANIYIASERLVPDGYDTLGVQTVRINQAILTRPNLLGIHRSSIEFYAGNNPLDDIQITVTSWDPNWPLSATDGDYPVTNSFVARRLG
jgi:hypothetical protein